jgi:ferrous iron transport protein A
LRPHRLSIIFVLVELKVGENAVARKKPKKPATPLDKDFSRAHTETILQLNGNSRNEPGATLMDLRHGDSATLDRIDLPGEDARRLMELGFLPGTEITAGRSAPGGDPRVFRVDGSEIALRRETARLLKIHALRKSRKS